MMDLRKERRIVSLLKRFLPVFASNNSLLSFLSQTLLLRMSNNFRGLNKLGQKYKNLTKIGEGGFGDVFAGEDLKTGKQIVLKVLHLSDRSSLKAFKTETKIYKKLKHENICMLFKAKVMKAEGKVFGIYVIEKLDMDLLCLILNCNYLAESLTRMIFKQICSSVAYLHSEGVVHLDLKPDNVLVTLSDNHITSVKLCDFGFARRFDMKKNPSSSYLMPAKERLGTREYLPPEVHSTSKENTNGLVYLCKLDVYALGVMLFTMLTGSFPNIFGDDGNLINALDLETVKNYSVSDDALNLLRGLMNPDPLQRPSLHEVLAHPWFVHNND